MRARRKSLQLDSVGAVPSQRFEHFRDNTDNLGVRKHSVISTLSSRIRQQHRERSVVLERTCNVKIALVESVDGQALEVS